MAVCRKQDDEYSTLPAGAEMKGVLSTMPRRINPGPPRRCIHFHTESATIRSDRILICEPEASSAFSAAFVISGDAQNIHGSHLSRVLHRANVGLTSE